MRNKNGGLTSSVVKDRYNKETYDQVNFRVKKGFKADIKAYANSSGLSLNQWIIDAIKEKMQRQDESFIEQVTGNHLVINGEII